MQKTNNEIKKAKEVVILSVKGSKKKPYKWTYIALQCQLLKNEYKSNKIIAELVGLEGKGETIRQILKINGLTQENKKRMDEDKFQMDVASRLANIKERDLQNIVGKTIENMTSHDARHIIEMAKKWPGDSVEKFKQAVLKYKAKKRHIIFTLLPLEEELYKKLKKEAKRNEISLERYIIQLIEKENK